MRPGCIPNLAVVELAITGKSPKQIAAALACNVERIYFALKRARDAGRLPRVRVDGETDSRSFRTLKPADFIRCARCGLRGHTAESCDLRGDATARKEWAE